MDTKREGSAWHRYALIEDDKALLAEMPAQVIVSGDKLTLLRDSPAEADIAPVGQLRRDTENGGVVPAAFEQQHCASSVLAQQRCIATTTHLVAVMDDLFSWTITSCTRRFATRHHPLLITTIPKTPMTAARTRRQQ
uniref:Uncharacterized protein n=1 Tax=Globodera rostochiensis TaxID=31243 RepID=A0A914HQT6_GLORO